MPELVNMPDMSPILRTCRLGTCSNPKLVDGGLRGPFCASKLGVPNIWVGEHFCMRGDPLKIFYPQPTHHRRKKTAFPSNPNQPDTPHAQGAGRESARPPQEHRGWECVCEGGGRGGGCFSGRVKTGGSGGRCDNNCRYFVAGASSRLLMVRGGSRLVVKPRKTSTNSR